MLWTVMRKDKILASVGYCISEKAIVATDGS